GRAPARRPSGGSGRWCSQTWRGLAGGGVVMIQLSALWPVCQAISVSGVTFPSLADAEAGENAPEQRVGVHRRGDFTQRRLRAAQLFRSQFSLPGLQLRVRLLEQGLSSVERLQVPG